MPALVAGIHVVPNVESIVTDHLTTSERSA